MEVRSYRRVFDLERRIYRIDRMRLNPGGIPVRGVIYFLAILAAALVARRIPLVSFPARTPPWYLIDLALPAAGAAVLTLIRVEGRPFHVAAHALLRYRFARPPLERMQARKTQVERWHPEDIILLPDGSDACLRRMQYTGPGGVLVALEHERDASGSGHLLGPRSRGRRVALRLQGPGVPRQALRSRKVIALAPGARLVVSRTRSPGQVRR